MTDSVPQTKGQPTAEAEVPLANRPPCEPLPAFRPDVDVLAQAEAGRPDRCLVRDPKSGLVFDFSSKDIFLCRQMDGRTPPEAIRARFRERYGLDISAEHLDAFIRQMGRSGLLTSAPQADESLLTWESMKPLRFLSGPRLARLERAVGWIFSTAGLILLGALWLGALFVLSRRGGEIAGQVQDLLRSLAQGGRRGGPSPEGYLGLAWILIFLPSLREVAKAVLFRRDTSRFAEVRYAWQWRCIPRLMFDVNALASMEKPIQRLHVAAAGLQVELLIIASSILGWDMQRMSGPIQSFLFSLGLASTLSFLFNAIPVGKQDGSLILAVWLDIPDLRRRAVQTARTWLPGRRPTARVHRIWTLRRPLCYKPHNCHSGVQRLLPRHVASGVRRAAVHRRPGAAVRKGDKESGRECSGTNEDREVDAQSETDRGRGIRRRAAGAGAPALPAACRRRVQRPAGREARNPR
jgi:hypothetical protein